MPALAPVLSPELDPPLPAPLLSAPLAVPVPVGLAVVSCVLVSELTLDPDAVDVGYSDEIGEVWPVGAAVAEAEDGNNDDDDDDGDGDDVVLGDACTNTQSAINHPPLTQLLFERL
jgi:hypothetical protein